MTSARGATTAEVFFPARDEFLNAAPAASNVDVAVEARVRQRGVYIYGSPFGYAGAS